MTTLQWILVILLVSLPALAQPAAELPPGIEPRALELMRLLDAEAPRWGDRIRAGQGSLEAAQMMMRSMAEKDPALIDLALDIARKAGDKYGEGQILAYQAMYTPLVLEERLTKWEQCLPLFDGIANPILCAHVRLMVGAIRLEDSNFVVGLDHFQKALPVLEKAGLKELEAEACLGLGNCLVKLDKDQDALPYLERAVQGYQSLEIEPRLARAEFVLGGALVALGRFSEAEQVLNSCVARFEELKEVPSALASRLFIGNIRERQGRIADALAINQDVNAKAESSSAGWPLRESTSNLARLFVNQGQYEQAEVWYRKALKRFQDAGDLQQAAQVRHTLAAMYLNQGRDRDAESLILESLSMLKASGLPYDTRSMQYDLTKLYWRQGRIDEAAQHFEAVMAPCLPLTIPPSSVSRPLRLWHAGERDEAIAAYRDLLAKVTSPKGDATIAEIKSGLVGALAEEKHYAEAIQYFNEIFQTDIRGTYLEPFGLMALGRLYLEAGRPQEAIEVLRQAEPRCAQLGGAIVALRLHQDLARAYQASGDQLAASAHLEQVLHLYDQLQREALYSGGVSSAVGMSRAFAWACGQLGLERLRSGDVGEAFLVMESGRDRLLAVDQIRRERYASPRAKALRAELAATVQKLAVVRISADPSQDTITSLQETCERLEVDLLRESRSFEVAKPDLRVIQESLTANDALLSLMWVEKELHGFLLRRDQIEHHTLRWSARDTATLLASLSAGGSVDEANPRLSAGYAQLIQPFEKSLAGVENLAVIPDGTLQTVPFETLIDADGKYLIENFDVTYLTSARSLAGQKPKLKLKPLVVGAPDYGAGSADTAWPALPGSRAEAESIAQLLNTKPLLGSAATKANFRSQAEKAGLLHIATHAFTAQSLSDSGPFASASSSELSGENARDPYLDSGIVFTGANDVSARQQGVLTAYEVLEMDLSNVELAVLSACETGRGKSTSGEGVLGLRRAFQAAGVHHLLTSLWAVDDAATSGFMTTFYQSLAAGTPPLKALSDAKRRQIKENIPPSAWGAFVLIGPIRESEPTTAKKR